MRRSLEREQAKLSGLKTYISNTIHKPCGTYEKYVANHGCVQCLREQGLKKLADDNLMAPYRTREKELKKLQCWRENNYSKWQKQWLNPATKHKRNEYAARRRTKKLNQTPSDADFQVIQQIYHNCRCMSEETGIAYEVDHIIPIARGGLHHQDNLQIIPAIENRKKGAR